MSGTGDETVPTRPVQPDPATVAQPRTTPATPSGTASPPSPATTGREAAIVTAEIPVVPTGPRHARSGPRLSPPDLNDAYGEVLPAPVALRAFVWVLFFIFLLALILLAIDHFHPGWLSFLRRGTAGSLRVSLVARARR